MKNLTTVIFLAFAASQGMAQAPVKTAQYTYDAAGNRTGKKIIYLTGGGGSTGQRLSPVKPQQDPVGEAVFTVAPNPTEGIVNINVNGLPAGTEPANVVLYDLSGKLLLSKRSMGGNIVVDLSDYAAGVYRLSLTQKGKESSWKIIKQ